GGRALYAHTVERNVQSPLVGFVQEAVAAPLVDDADHDLAILLVVRELLGRHRQDEALLEPARELRQDLGLAPPDEYRRQCATDPVEIAVADHPASVVDELVVVEEAVRRPEPVAVDELDERDQLLESVLQRGTAEDDRVGRPDLLDAPRSARRPVLDALGLVEDYDVGRPALNHLEVAVDGVVVGDLVESVGEELGVPRGKRTT